MILGPKNEDEKIRTAITMGANKMVTSRAQVLAGFISMTFHANGYKAQQIMDAFGQYAHDVVYLIKKEYDDITDTVERFKDADGIKFMEELSKSIPKYVVNQDGSVTIIENAQQDPSMIKTTEQQKTTCNIAKKATPKNK